MDKKTRIWSPRDVELFLGKVFTDKARDPGTYRRLKNHTILPKSVSKMDFSSDRVREAFQACAESTGGDIVLIIGPGGCGKSLIYKGVAHSLPKALCLAPTGVAAKNLKADGWYLSLLKIYNEPKTIQRGLGLPVSDYYTVKMADEAAERIRHEHYSHIMVDEVSMVTPNLLDLLAHIARRLDIPLLLFGDPMQLPPVDGTQRRTDSDSVSLSDMYCDCRFFYSYSWMMQKDSKLRVVLLDSVYRQDDPGFKSLLNRARIGRMTDEDMQLLRSREVEEPPEDSLILCYRKNEVAAINKARQGSIVPSIRCDGKFRSWLVGDDFKNRIRIEWEESAKGCCIDSDIALALVPRKDGGPDSYPWNDLMAEDDAGRHSDVMSESTERVLSLYPGDNVMITRNLSIPILHNVSTNLLSLVSGVMDTGYSSGTICRYPLDEDAATEYIVNGTMGTYLGVANNLVSPFFGEELERIRYQYDGTPDLTDRLVEAIRKNRNEEYGECEYLVVRLHDNHGTVVLVPRVEFGDRRLMKDGRFLETERVEQFPLIPSFAITFHKSQGLTLDKVHLMLYERNAYPPAIGYLGLSRCTSLEGLTMNTFVENAFKCDPQAARFLKILEKRYSPLEEDEIRRYGELLSGDWKEEVDGKPLLAVPGITSRRFRSMRSAYVFCHLADMSRWTSAELDRLAGASDGTLSILEKMIRGYDLTETEKDEVHELALPIAGCRKFDDRAFLEKLHSKVKELHPELTRLLNRNGWSSESSEGFMNDIASVCGKPGLYLSSVFDSYEDERAAYVPPSF